MKLLRYRRHEIIYDMLCISWAWPTFLFSPFRLTENGSQRMFQTCQVRYGGYSTEILSNKQMKRLVSLCSLSIALIMRVALERHCSCTQYGHDVCRVVSSKMFLKRPSFCPATFSCVCLSLKVRIQLLGSMTPDVKKPSFPSLLAHMIKTDGVSSVYAGLSAAIMRQAIYGTARIGLHRTFSDKLQEVRNLHTEARVA